METSYHSPRGLRKTMSVYMKLPESKQHPACKKFWLSTIGGLQVALVRFDYGNPFNARDVSISTESEASGLARLETAKD